MDLLSALTLLLLLILIGSAVYFDLKERRIPNKVTLPGLVAGLFMGAVGEGGLPLLALGGAGLAFLLTFPLVALRGLGAGDAKFLIAVGAFVGPWGLISVFLYGAVAGGVLALGSATAQGALRRVLVNVWNLLLHLLTLGRYGRRLGLDSPDARSVPYGLAIAAGALATWFFPLALGGSP